MALMTEVDGHTSGGIPKALSKLRATVATKLKPPAGLADQARPQFTYLDNVHDNFS